MPFTAGAQQDNINPYFFLAGGHYDTRSPNYSVNMTFDPLGPTQMLATAFDHLS